MLTLVPTPIGNLEDMTFRGIRVLSEVDSILAEDTRQTLKILKHYNISKPLSAFHQHNEHKAVNRIIERLIKGEKIAIVSDAGTPGISDPGFLLVRECLKHAIKIETLPGATAFVPALVNSGLPCDRFVFEGFLPQKKGRKTRLELLSNELRTIVIYESPHRLIKTLRQFTEYFGKERPICVSRELTKIFEENIRGKCEDVLTHYELNPPKGEIVIIVGGKN